MALSKRPIRSAKTLLFRGCAKVRFLKVYVAAVPAAAKHILGRGHLRRGKRQTRHSVAPGTTRGSKTPSPGCSSRDLWSRPPRHGADPSRSTRAV